MQGFGQKWLSLVCNKPALEMLGSRLIFHSTATRIDVFFHQAQSSTLTIQEKKNTFNQKMQLPYHCATITVIRINDRTACGVSAVFAIRTLETMQ